MPFSPASPVTGGPQTGLTSPTYTLSADAAPAAHGKQYVVTALGGTQTGVEVHSLSNPFTLTAFKTAVPKTLPAPNPSTGVLSSVPKNVQRILGRKGIEVLSGQPRQVASIDVTISLPAGGDVQDPESIRALYSLVIGALWEQSANVGTMAINNNL